MRRTDRLLAISLVAAVSALSPAILQAQQYIYTNDNIQFNSGNNTTTAYKVSSTGKVTAIKTYLTGGLGSNGSYFAQIEIASAQTDDQRMPVRGRWIQQRCSGIHHKDG